MYQTDRRDALCFGATAITGCLGWDSLRAAANPKPLPVAAVVTVYRPNSHADLILTKILQGWRHDGKGGPALRLASLYVDQFPKEDMARALCKKYDVPIFKTIQEAVTVGSKAIPVNGVLSIGEHGNYPTNKIGQHLYPRRRFFQEITDAFQKFGRVVPVFSDKHLGPVWEDARWMYDRAVKMKVPFMAGSSLPVTFRSRALDVPMGSDIESAVMVGYSGLDIYGSHALECYQAIVERRRQAETGVRWVQCLQGKALWQAVDGGQVPKDVLDAVYEIVLRAEKRGIREDKQAILFLFEYLDGFHGAVFMLSNASRNGIAVKLRGARQPSATTFEERPEPHYPHFAYLLKAIEAMIHTGRPSYPVERTLLTSGILDRALTSRSQGNRQLKTPELAVAYRPIDYPHAPRLDLLAPPPAK